MFIATVINFILSSLNTGTQVAGFIGLIRNALILDIDYPLLEKPELINNALRNVNSHLLGSIPPCEHQAVAVESHIYSSSVETLLSDLIVTWRAWALFPDRQWVILIPLILWIPTVGEHTFPGSSSLLLNL